MSQETTQQNALSAPAVAGNYLGADAPSSFGDPARELQALQSGCGIFGLGWRAQITAGGKDRVRWLHNMVTNNVRDLKLNRGNYDFVLNAQGRILGDLYIFNRGEFLLLETDRAQVETLLATLKRFIIMDKVELAADSARAGVGMCGPKAQQILAAAGVDVTTMEPLEVRDVNVFGTTTVIIRGPEQKPFWYELWTDTGHSGTVLEKLAERGAQPVGWEALEAWRVLHGIPQYGQDIRERDLPQETEQSQALNFNKGCYIGQEIVERIRSRGQVHRKLTGFEFEGPASPGKHDAEGRVLAEVTTAIGVPTSAGQKYIGLGYVRREAVPSGTAVEINGVSARVVDLPFQI
jgi:folate-binding protein YgfZ